jgi:hypothetical protein
MSTGLTERLLDPQGRPSPGTRRWLAATLALAFGVAFAVSIGSSDGRPARPAPAAAPRNLVATPPTVGRLRHVAPLPGPRFAAAPPARRAAPAEPVIRVASPTPRSTVTTAITSETTSEPAAAPRRAPAAPAPAHPKTFDSSGSQTFDSSGSQGFDSSG